MTPTDHKARTDLNPEYIQPCCGVYSDYKRHCGNWCRCSGSDTLCGRCGHEESCHSALQQKAEPVPAKIEKVLENLGLEIEWQEALGGCKADDIRVRLEAIGAIKSLWQQVDDLAMLVARLARSLKNVNKNSAQALGALDYLKRNGLEGSPLRTETIPLPHTPEPPALPAERAELVASALSLARECLWSESITGLPTLPEYREKAIEKIDAALSASEPVQAEPLTDALSPLVKPSAIYHGMIDCGEYGAFNLEILFLLPHGAKLYTESQLNKAHALGRKQALAEAVAAIPTTWLDPLLSGSDSIKIPAGCPDIEKLLLGIKACIQEIEAAHGIGAAGGGE